MKKYRIIVFSIFFVFAGAIFPESALSESVNLLNNSITMISLVLTAALVFFMQAGFAMVETGLTRAGS
ncbi:MAG: hypothetical protein DRP57_08950 [Spirochaetes bacterium]|nr:MAG: hypothetical protein DRP57_08950 [Spirochaetota bacterium]